MRSQYLQRYFITLQSALTGNSILDKKVNWEMFHIFRDLFAFYSPDARAGLDSSETVTAKVQYTLLRIRKLVRIT